MSAFYSKLWAIFLSKSQKMRYLHCVVKFQLRKLSCGLTWYENAVPQLRNCVALQLNQKVHCGSCAALQKLKKINCAFCAALLLVETIVALSCRCTFDVIYLCPPLSKSNSHNRLWATSPTVLTLILIPNNLLVLGGYNALGKYLAFLNLNSTCSTN